jgi:serine/threonine protein kinase
MIKHKHRENRLRRELEKYNLPEGAMDVLERMLCLDPKKRISAMDAFNVRLQ